MSGHTEDKTAEGDKLGGDKLGGDKLGGMSMSEVPTRSSTVPFSSASESQASVEAAEATPCSCASRLGAWMYPLSSSGAAGREGGAPRLEALDAPRWIASIQIVVYHMYHGERGLKEYATWFACWTQLFFLLSGFVLSYAELAKPPKVGKGRVSLFRYVRRRLVIIYPAFFLSLLLKVTYAPGRNAFEWAMLPLHALLMQSWLPICVETQPGSVSCSPWMYNGEAWFLSVLVIFWLCLRPLAEFFRRRSLRFSCGTLVVCWLFAFIFQLLGREDRLAMWLGCEDDKLCTFTIMVAIRATPFGYFHVFVAGVAAARVFMLLATRDAESGERVGLSTRRVVLAEQHAPLLLRFGCCVGYLVYAGMLLLTTKWIETHYYFFHNGGMLPVMLLVLIGAAIGKDPITVWVFRSKPMLTLGRISYLQYLMQHVLQGWVKRTFGWEDNHTAKVLFLPALLLFSYCCQRWVEKPYTEYQRWRGEKGVKGCDDRCIDRLERLSAKAPGVLRSQSLTSSEPRGLSA
eukprot:CAMPEP_0176039728 /NCGR_PEP_ID=MMETSP0120_2-20121206/19695_1 /TAXON_ID=160619 /ORGANISM="Kryptoperidinium foliaceum, Strain CCMP 1326" /LENGTH=515 /DNA_ID=CAMNT_0017373123 /DNA_START=39 /DNA_END=1586 /DNA_ORIENTATION=-